MTDDGVLLRRMLAEVCVGDLLELEDHWLRVIDRKDCDLILEDANGTKSTECTIGIFTLFPVIRSTRAAIIDLAMIACG